MKQTETPIEIFDVATYAVDTADTLTSGKALLLAAMAEEQTAEAIEAGDEAAINKASEVESTLHHTFSDYFGNTISAPENHISLEALIEESGMEGFEVLCEETSYPVQ